MKLLRKIQYNLIFENKNQQHKWTKLKFFECFDFFDGFASIYDFAIEHQLEMNVFNKKSNPLFIRRLKK